MLTFLPTGCLNTFCHKVQHLMLSVLLPRCPGLHKQTVVLDCQADGGDRMPETALADAQCLSQCRAITAETSWGHHGVMIMEAELSSSQQICLPVRSPMADLIQYQVMSTLPVQHSALRMCSSLVCSSSPSGQCCCTADPGTAPQTCGREGRCRFDKHTRMHSYCCCYSSCAPRCSRKLCTRFASLMR